MKRGDIVAVAAGSGFGGKPRPALVMQSDVLAGLSTVIVLLFTSELVDPPSPLRVRVIPDAANGLMAVSELMVHAPVTVRREKIGGALGRLGASDLARAERALLSVLGFGG